VQTALADLVGAQLPGTLLFDYPNIDAIANYLMDEILEISEDGGGGGGGGWRWRSERRTA
jgi:hypothetical protein